MRTIQFHLAVAALVVLFLGSPSSRTAAADIHAEVIEWVMEPCVMVQAALDAQDLDEETIEMGIKLKHIVQLMVADKDAAVRKLVKNMNPNLPWERRAAV